MASKCRLSQVKISPMREVFGFRANTAVSNATYSAARYLRRKLNLAKSVVMSIDATVRQQIPSDEDKDRRKKKVSTPTTRHVT